VHSALYLGRVRHRRYAPVAHRLVYPLFMAYIDLDELDDVFCGSLLWSARRPAVAWLRRADYLGDPDVALAEATRLLVSERTGRRPAGAVRLLTHPRTLGFRMNPVSFYYCFDADDDLEALVSEVTNTPWDERHYYVIDRETAAVGRSWSARLAKQFHVSPFLPMEMEYRWRFAPPGRRLGVHIENFGNGRKLFDATLSLGRRELTPQSLRAVVWRYPAMTLRVFLWIYLDALRLKLKGVPFFPHPRQRPNPATETRRIRG